MQVDVDLIEDTEFCPFTNRLTITKNKETCTDDDGSSVSAETSPTTDELASMMKKKMMMKKQLGE